MEILPFQKMLKNFSINLIPLHVLVLVISGNFTNKVYIAYTTFYVLGQLMAMQVSSHNLTYLLQSSICKSTTWMGYLFFIGSICWFPTSQNK
jgi:hypothetical protein